MADKPNNKAEQLDSILDGLAEYIEDAPSEEILEDAHQEGRDTKRIAIRTKGILQLAVKTYRQRELTKAKEGYELKVAEIKQRVIALPSTPEKRRSWLEAVFSQQPQLQAAFTMQNRDFSQLTDEDVASHLRKLEMLGVLKDINLPEDDD